MNGHEQVGAHAPCLVHALDQRHIVVVVACHDHAQILFLRQQLAYPVRHGQYHFLLVRAFRAGGTRILAAMAGVQRHGEDAGHLFLCRLAAAGGGRR